MNAVPQWSDEDGDSMSDNTVLIPRAAEHMRARMEFIAAEAHAGAWAPSRLDAAVAELEAVYNASRALPHTRSIARIQFNNVGIAGLSSSASVAIGAQCQWEG